MDTQPSRIKTIRRVETNELDKSVNKYLRKGWMIYSPITYVPVPILRGGFDQDEGFYFVVMYHPNKI
jgi:hypothetical protein